VANSLTISIGGKGGASNGSLPILCGASCSISIN